MVSAGASSQKAKMVDPRNRVCVLFTSRSHTIIHFINCAKIPNQIPGVVVADQCWPEGSSAVPPRRRPVTDVTLTMIPWDFPLEILAAWTELRSGAIVIHMSLSCRSCKRATMTLALATDLAENYEVGLRGVM